MRFARRGREYNSIYDVCVVNKKVKTNNKIVKTIKIVLNNKKKTDETPVLHIFH